MHKSEKQEQNKREEAVFAPNGAEKEPLQAVESASSRMERVADHPGWKAENEDAAVDLAYAESTLTDAGQAKSPKDALKKIFAPHHTRKLMDTAMFVAIGICLNMVSFPVMGSYGQFSLVYAYCYLCGILLGPVHGALAAGLSDMLEVFIMGKGIIPMISIKTAIMALIPGLIFKYVKGSFNLKLALSVVLNYFICTIALHGVAMMPFFDMFPLAFAKALGNVLNIESPFIMIGLSQAITQPIWICLNTLLTVLIYKRIGKIYQRRYAKPTLLGEIKSIDKKRTAD